jgi:regulatory protein YycI of two-component signal transduction system YycFG
MDWSKIKTIFIITFLILDVYLLFQFMKIRDANKYELITETSAEDNLKAADIQYGELPKVPIKEQYLSAKPKTFNKGDLVKLKGKIANIKEPSPILQVTLDKPIQLSSKFEPAELTSFLKENILYGDQYQFGEKDDKNKTITYFQQYENSPLFKNEKGMIIFKLSLDNQIISYQQTYLEDIAKMNAKADILPPLKAIETLHQKGMLKSKSKITKVELGYATIPLAATHQILAPTWRIVVDDKESLFVNAFEGQIIDLNNENNSKVE